MTLTAPERPKLTSQAWAGHWHGFGPWIGDPGTYHKEGNRRPPHPEKPGPSPNFDTSRYHQAAAEFATGSVPPLMSGHWLMKRGQATRDRTWTDVTDAVDWLRRHYSDAPPYERSDGRHAYGGLDIKIEYALDVLPRGVDVSWVYYTQSRTLFSASVVCCPNLHHPDLACPLPPS